MRVFASVFADILSNCVHLVYGYEVSHMDILGMLRRSCGLKIWIRARDSADWPRVGKGEYRLCWLPLALVLVHTGRAFWFGFGT